MIHRGLNMVFNNNNSSLQASFKVCMPPPLLIDYLIIHISTKVLCKNDLTKFFLFSFMIF